MLRKLADGGSAYTATRLRVICAQIFRHAIATDRADRNPAGDLRGALEVPRVKHRPALTTRREFGEFLRNLPELPADDQVGGPPRRADVDQAGRAAHGALGALRP